MPLRSVDQTTLVQLTFLVAVKVETLCPGGDLLRLARRIETVTAAPMTMPATMTPRVKRSMQLSPNGDVQVDVLGHQQDQGPPARHAEAQAQQFPRLGVLPCPAKDGSGCKEKAPFSLVSIEANRQDGSGHAPRQQGRAALATVGE